MSPDHSHRRRWLCIAYAFPPINRSGAHRPAAFVKHLHTLGWDATVLTVKPDREPTDDNLLARVPPSTRVLRTDCADPIRWLKRSLNRRRAPISNRDRKDSLDAPTSDLGRIQRCRQSTTARSAVDLLTGLLQTPDSRIGWWPSAVRAGLREIREHRPAVIYSTSPYATAHLIALTLHNLSGIPWVADFRDPWRGNPFRERKPDAADRLDAWLESIVVRRADWIVCNTPTATADFCRRYSGLARKCSTILNGIDPDAFSKLKPERPIPGHCFILTHCGQFYGRRRPHPWFAALAELRRIHPDLAGRVRFVAIGSPEYHGTPLATLASSYGVDEMFVAVGAVAHARALQLMAGSDVLVLAGAAGPGGNLQIPNKLFEYLGLRRPILAAICPDNPAEVILREAQADFEICPPDDAAGIASGMHGLFLRKEERNDQLWGGISAFHRDVQAEKLARIFERIAPVRRGSCRLSLTAVAPQSDLNAHPGIVMSGIV